MATTLIGVLAGHWLRSGRSPFEKDAGLFVAGWFGVAARHDLGCGFPINKALWTSSFVLLTAGLGLQTLAVCYWLIDIHGIRAWSRPFAIFGMNAIAAYRALRTDRPIARDGRSGRTSQASMVTAKGWARRVPLRPWGSRR